MNEENFIKEDSEKIIKEEDMINNEEIGEKIKEGEEMPEKIEKEDNRISECDSSERICLNIEDIKEICYDLDSFIEKNERIPNYIEFKENIITIPNCLYILSKTLSQLFKKEPINVLLTYEVNDIQPIIKDVENYNLDMTLEEYAEHNERIIEYIEATGHAPSFIMINESKIPYTDLVFNSLEILIYKFFKPNHILRSYINSPSIRTKVPYFNGYETKSLFSRIYNYIFLRK